jgi:hypothetical protein
MGMLRAGMSEAGAVASPGRAGAEEGSRAGAPSSALPLPEHLVQFYEDDELHSVAVAKFLGGGIPAGDSLVVIATGAHWQDFRRRLESLGFDVAGVCASGQLTFLDAHETLSRFMRNGEPERELFELEVGGVVARLAAALSGPARLRAYGEMVDVLWREGQRKAAIRLEELWNELQERHSFTLLCAYSMAGFYKEPSALHSVCSQHTHIIGEAGVGANGGTADPHVSTLPPQYARRLAEEIARRQEVELALRESLRELRHKEEELQRSSRAARSRRGPARLRGSPAGQGRIDQARRHQLQRVLARRRVHSHPVLHPRHHEATGGGGGASPE